MKENFEEYFRFSKNKITNGLELNEFVLLAGAHLPDDDYTTLVPPVKLSNLNFKRKSTSINEKKDERSSLSPKSIIQDRHSSSKIDNERKTTITGVSNRRSTIDADFIEQTRSAPVSPALNRSIKQRSIHRRIPLDTLVNVR